MTNTMVTEKMVEADKLAAIKEAMTKAVWDALETGGIELLKATSMFLSNRTAALEQEQEAVGPMSKVPLEEFCPFKKGQILVCDKPTNFHKLGEVVLVVGTDKRYTNDTKPYWVCLFGKPGHYYWGDFRLAGEDEIAAALAAPVATREDVVRELDDWHEDDGYSVWWTWQDGDWLGEPSYIGSPLCSDWPGYHTHWTPHPTFPPALSTLLEGGR